MSGTKVKSPPSAPGYSGKPLWQKLGLKPQMRVLLAQAPADYWTLCDFDERDVELVAHPRERFEFGHLFVSARVELAKALVGLTPRLDANGMLWISWPKKSSGVASDVSEDVLREVVLPLGLVDVKVCAVSATWSGLKFVWRRERRANLSK